MKTLKTAVLSLVLVVHASASEEPPTLRGAELTIVCKDQTGAPVGGLPFIGTTSGGKWFAITDSSGRAVTQVSVAPDERELFAMVGVGNLPPTVDEALANIALSRLLQVSQTHAIPKFFSVPLDAGQGVLQLNVTLAPGRAVKVRCVDSLGSPIGGVTMLMSDYRLVPSKPSDGWRRVVGVPADGVRIVWAETFEGAMAPVIVPPSADETDLGQVTVSLPPQDSTVQLTFRGQLDPRFLDIGPEPFLVSTDGHTLIQLNTAGGKTTRSASSDEPSRVPAGEYWVCPSSFLTGISADILLNLVRSGADLSGSGIPKIVVRAGNHLEQEIDVAGAQRAILVAGGHAVPAGRP